MHIIIAVAILALALPAWGQPKGREKEWTEVVAAARKEGKVVVVTSPDPVMREIAAKFKERFGIAVEHVAGRSSEIAGRLRSERQAGVYTVDVFMGGIQTVATILYREKMLDPIKPAILLPEVADPAKWKKGRLWLVDPEEQYVARPFSTISNLLHVNASQVRPEDLRTARDLLNPKWKGKISTEDPTTSGSGSNTAARVYAQMGEDFMTKLYIDQKPAITRERRQLTDWLARGTYPIAFGAHDSDVDKMRKEGFPIKEIYGFPDMPPALTGSPWQIVLLNRAPDANAAKVFVNWMLSKEALEIYARGEGNATLRTDVDESFLLADVIPRPGINYFDTYDWEWTVSGKEKVRLRLKEILGR